MRTRHNATSIFAIGSKSASICVYLSQPHHTDPHDIHQRRHLISSTDGSWNTSRKTTHRFRGFLWSFSPCWMDDMLTIYVVNKHGQNTVYRLWPKPFTHLFILQLTLHHSISKQLPNSDPPKVHVCLSTLPTNMTSSPAFNFQQKTSWWIHWTMILHK